MKPTIDIYLVARRKPIRLTLPENYQSEQWLSDIAESLEDAEEVARVEFEVEL